MSYNGQYLVKAGDYIIPPQLIKWDTYEVTPESRQDLDPYRDANGVLHRQVLEHRINKIEFETVAMEEDKALSLFAGLRSAYINQDERSCTVSYYDVETGAYKSGKFYVPDYKPKINLVGGVVKYSPLRLAFIEY